MTKLHLIKMLTILHEASELYLFLINVYFIQGTVICYMIGQ